MNDLIYAIVVPIAGWVWKVEQRLMRLTDIEEDVKETHQDVKDIYRHLIGERPHDGQAERQERS